MIVVNARCSLLPGHQAGFIEEVRQIIPLVHKEAGCIRYELVADVYNPGNFLFIEEWESRDHLENHIASPHMKAYFAKSTSWFSEPVELRIYEISSVESFQP